MMFDYAPKIWLYAGKNCFSFFNFMFFFFLFFYLFVCPLFFLFLFLFVLFCFVCFVCLFFVCMFVCFISLCLHLLCFFYFCFCLFVICLFVFFFSIYRLFQSLYFIYVYELQHGCAIRETCLFVLKMLDSKTYFPNRFFQEWKFHSFTWIRVLLLMK